jgi:hypothetical protein
MAGRSGAPASPAAPLAEAPPVQGVDEAPPQELQMMLDQEFAPLAADFGHAASSTAIMTAIGTDFWTWGGGSTSTTTTPTAAQLAQFRAELETRRAAIELAPGSSPRLVARLPLAGGGNALFVAWHNRDGLLCTETQIVDASGGGGGGGASGPCSGTDQGTRHCAALCLASDGAGSDMAHETWVLSGTVAADADSLDVTTSDGATAEYPLTGPVLDGGDRRVFMLELGKTDWRKLTLLRGGRVVDELAMPAFMAATEDCTAKTGPMPPPKPPATPGSAPVVPAAEMQAWKTSFEACVTATGSLPAPPAPTP